MASFNSEDGDLKGFGALDSHPRRALFFVR
jgi:hypothetical protein